MVEAAQLCLRDEIATRRSITRGASSPTEFNEVTKWPVALPITGGGMIAWRIGIAVPITDIKTHGVVRCPLEVSHFGINT